MVEQYENALTIEQDHPSRRVREDVLERLIHHVIDAEGGTLIHLSLVLTDHGTVRSLNRRYLGHDYDTDVLAFSLHEEDSYDSSLVEGEIYVDLDTAAERHDEFDSSFEREVQRYTAHGLLHLMGYDDTSNDEQELMRTLEDRYLNAVFSSS